MATDLTEILHPNTYPVPIISRTGSGSGFASTNTNRRCLMATDLRQILRQYSIISGT